MKRFWLLLTAILLSGLLKAQETTVFTSGREGFKSFRIPAVVRLPDGALLAFCEGRVNGAADFGNVKIVMKKSTDGGKTWGALQTIVSNDSLQAGNASPVVDLTDPEFPKGRIFLFYNTGNVPENRIRNREGVREVWYKTSADGGQSWSAPVNITLQVHRPYQPNYDPRYDFEEDWRSYANGPSHAMQFLSGRYKGRIYVAANHSAGQPQRRYADGRAHGFYTDDHGKTFKLSDNVETPGGNESTAAELPGGALMLNARNQLGNVRSRIVAVSKDGGQSWSKTYFDQNLPDPVCQGSILTLDVRGKGTLAFCNAADTLNRDHLTLRISRDGGNTWSINKLLAQAPEGYKGDYSAYSDIVKLGEYRVGVLFEKDNYHEITFEVVDWNN